MKKKVLLATLMGFSALSAHGCTDCIRFEHSLPLPQFSQCSVYGPTLVAHKDHYELQIPAPGFAKEEIKVATEAGLLTAQGHQKQDKTNANVVFGNTSQSFFYQFPLGQDVLEETLKAELKNGVLFITAKKDPKKAEKKIEIK